jgi:hypothetical protein
MIKNIILFITLISALVCKLVLYLNLLATSVKNIIAYISFSFFFQLKRGQDLSAHV